MKFLKKIRNFLSTTFKKYQITTRRINNITNFKAVIKASLGALLVAILAFSVPLLLAINLLIMTEIRLLVAISMIVILGGLVFLYYLIYFKILKNYFLELQDFSQKIVIIIEASAISLLIILIGTVFLIIYF